MGFRRTNAISSTKPARSRPYVKWVMGFLASLVLLIVLFFAFIAFELKGSGGWDPDKNSPYAARARAVAIKLHKGMARSEVRKIFADDIARFPSDTVEDASDAYWGEGVPRWPEETDFSVFEPRRHWWNSFDTTWTVRTRFDKHGKLFEYNLRMDAAGGP